MPAATIPLRAGTTVQTTVALTSVALSQPQPLDLAVYRGDTGGFRVTVTDADGLPVDVSTRTWLSQIRATADSADPPMAVLTITPVAGDTASIDVTLDAANSAKLKGTTGGWDLQMSDGANITTLLAGKVLITPDYSR